MSSLIRPKGAMNLTDLKRAVQWETPIYKVSFFRNNTDRIRLIFPVEFSTLLNSSALKYESTDHDRVINHSLFLKLFNVGSPQMTKNFLFTDEKLALTYVGSNP